MSPDILTNLVYGTVLSVFLFSQKAQNWSVNVLPTLLKMLTNLGVLIWADDGRGLQDKPRSDDAALAVDDHVARQRRRLGKVKKQRQFASKIHSEKGIK
jgi:hypothetical protein